MHGQIWSVYQIDMKFNRQLRQQHRLRRWSRMVVKQFQDGGRPPFLKSIAISQWKIIRFRWNFVHSSRFWTGWTSRDQKWKVALDRLRIRQNVFLFNLCCQINQCCIIYWSVAAQKNSDKAENLIWAVNYKANHFLCFCQLISRCATACSVVQISVALAE